jgi:hypothetical protein
MGKKKHVFTFDFSMGPVSTRLHARSEMWNHVYDDSSRLYLKSSKIAYSYNPRDFREGSILDAASRPFRSIGSLATGIFSKGFSFVTGGFDN